MAITPVTINAYTTVNALGKGIEASAAALYKGQSGLRMCDFEHSDLDTWIGRVANLESETLAAEPALFDCRNHRLAQLALQQDGFADAVDELATQLGPARIGVFIGTSTSGILSTESAYRDSDNEQLPAHFSYRHSHDIFAAAAFVQRYLNLSGPAIGISTACSSSAKVFASAHRYMQAGLCDAALVGGIDSLCLTTLYGFHALQLTASSPCRPWDVQRDGINIGEAAGFMLLSQNRQSTANSQTLALLGYGESSDAYHMSAAHPEGVGASLAMREALQRANLKPEQIDYINLHGTATLSNDAAEDSAVVNVFGDSTNTSAPPCSSTKGWTGHTLGACGIVEAVFACLCMDNDFIPGTLNTECPDPKLSAAIQLQSQQRRVNTVLSNSFGFGGSNCSLILGKQQ